MFWSVMHLSLLGWLDVVLIVGRGVVLIFIGIVDVEAAHWPWRLLIIRFPHLDWFHVTAYCVLLSHIMLSINVRLIVQALILRRNLQRNNLLILHLSHIEFCFMFRRYLARHVSWVLREGRATLCLTRQPSFYLFGGLSCMKLVFSLLFIENDVLENIITWIGQAVNVRAPLIRVLIVLARSSPVRTRNTASQILLDFKLAPLDLARRLAKLCLDLRLHLWGDISVRKVVIVTSIARIFGKMFFGRPSILGIALTLLQLLMVLVPWFIVTFVNAARLNFKTVRLLIFLVGRGSLPCLLGQTWLLLMMPRLAIRDHCCGLIERFHGLK